MVWFKMAIDIKKENWISTRSLASVLMLSLERVRQLEEEGYFTCKAEKNRKQYDLIPSVQIYIEYLRKQKENPLLTTMEDEARKLKADADLKEAKAAIENLKKAELEATMHRSEDVEAVITDLAATIRGELLALPGTLAVDMANTTTATECSAIIKAAVNTILNRLTDYNYDKNEFKRRVREREKWMNAQENREETEEETS